MIDELLGMLKEIDAKRAEFMGVMARLYKEAYDQLVAAGFTGEQAMAIVVGQGIGISAKK